MVKKEPLYENLFMNLEIGDVSVNQTRTYQSRNKEDEDRVSDLFNNSMYQDNPNIENIWNKSNSRREFVTQPNNSVPNKSIDLANWLYGIPKDKGLCKSGTIWLGYGINPTNDTKECGYTNNKPDESTFNFDKSKYNYN